MGSTSVARRQQFEPQEYYEPVAVETATSWTTCATSCTCCTGRRGRRCLGEEILGNIDRRRLPGDSARRGGGVHQPDGPGARPEVESGPGGGGAGGDRAGTGEAAGRKRLPACPCSPGPRSRTPSGWCRTFDPPGIGARDLRECLLLQMREDPREDPLAQHRDAGLRGPEGHRWSDLSKRITGWTPKGCRRRRHHLALDPKPGLKYANRSGRTTSSPDLIVEKIDGEYHVFLNDTSLPRLRLSARTGDRPGQEQVHG
jgi:hypothetical protein